MQRVLEKMAKKLNEYDEASLMNLWHHYAMQVHEFEPSKRWEEAAIALSLIQAVHWKNQLFNYHLGQTSMPLGMSEKAEIPPLPNFFTQKRQQEPHLKEAVAKKTATILNFPGKKSSTALDEPSSGKDPE